MEFETKKALLEYRGKNPDDRKLVDRWISKWEVGYRDGMYYIVDKDAIIEGLRNEIKELKENKSERVVEKVVEKDGWDETLKKELEEAKIQWDYWEKRCKRYWEYMEKVISVTYDRIKPMLWNKLEEKSEFREHIIEEIKNKQQ